MLAPPPPVAKRQNILQRMAAAILPPPRATPFREMGTAGTSIYGGYVQALEKSPKWTGRQKYITISDMVVNTSIIAAGFHYFLNLVAHPQWTITPADVDNESEAKAVAELIEEALHDMDIPWSRVVRRAATFRFYGFGVQEWTAKRRTDGRVGLASIEPRPQHTIDQWSVREDGTLEGVWQRSPQTGELLGLPRSKILYLVDDAITDSPEGTGIFRMLAEPWERLKTYYDLEARAYERDLRGIPIGRVPYSLIRQAVEDGSLTEAEANTLTEGMENFVKLQVKQSNTSITLDSLPYFSQAADGNKVAAVPQWGLELLQGSSNGVKELGEAIIRTQHEMARIIAPGIESLLMGENSGNRSLGEDKSRNLAMIGDSVLGDISAGVEHDIIARICDLNNIPEELRPSCEVESVSFKDAEAIAATLERMARAGAVLAPDDPVVEDVRGLMGVSAPNPPDAGMLTSVSDAGSEDADIDDEDDEDEDDDVELDAEEEDLNKVEPRTLYVCRKLVNGEDVRAWAASQGIQSTLPPEDMHVTIAFSRELVDWSVIRPDEEPMVVLQTERRDVHQFPARTTPNGAVVLRIQSRALHNRWQELKDAGASWDFPEYHPHVTLTYSVAEADTALIEPYTGPLIFGPEIFAEVNDGWAGEIQEEPTIRKRGVPRRKPGST